MTHAKTRDDFYGICGLVAALILAVALGVPALHGPAGSDGLAAGSAQPGAAAETTQNTARAAQPLLPQSAAAEGG